MSLGIWEYFWTEADWVPPGPGPVGQVPAATRYAYRYRVNYVTGTAIMLMGILLAKLKQLPELYFLSLRHLRFIRARA